MIIKTEFMARSKIAYLRKHGPYGTSNSELMNRFKIWAQKEKLLDKNSVILGIAQDNPERTKPEECRYDVCLIINDEILINDELVKESVLEEGEYMVILIAHTPKSIKETYKNLFKIAKHEGVIIDFKKPIIERYNSKLIKNHQCEICIPIQNRP